MRALPRLTSALLLVAAFALKATASPADSRAPRTEATYRQGKLALILAYHATQAGPGTLTTDLLDPEDHVLATEHHAADALKGAATWQQVLTPASPLPLEDIVWLRLRYRFDYADRNTAPIEGIESVSRILRRPILHVLAQSQYLAGSQAAIRVIVGDSSNTDATETGALHIELLAPPQKPRILFTGHLDRRGTVDAQFRLPAGLTGSYQLRYTADTPIGSADFTQPITLQDKASILLTTEKPLYQPGQTIHIRALALDRADQKADAARPLTFELEDSRGNKVFKHASQTDKFGIASTEFTLADEVNLGAYHLRALMGSPESPTSTSELTLNVERYVLPRFKVAVEFTEKDHKPRRDYRPGDHVTGTVRANYFFGKPVDRAEIKLKASAADVAVFEAATSTGTTDSDGVYHFDLKLPTYFAGKPITQGAARALVEATVKDSAGHAETRGEPITISQNPLLIVAVPEGGALLPKLENQVYLLTSYADGTPAQTSLTVRVPPSSRLLGEADQHLTTDAGGVAVLHLIPGASLDSLHIDADDHHGSRTSGDVPLESREGDEQVLLRTDRALYKPGDRIQLQVFSTRIHGSAYIDIVRNGQTILTRDVDLENGQAGLTLTATPDMAGTLDIDAYLFGRDAQPVASHRLVFVQPADELHIETVADAASYKPGAEARIHFHVTNAQGQGVSAALGLQVVDEAVFALAEKQPGFARVFFYLEQEAMKPRYEIHSLSMPALLEPVHSGGEGPVPLTEATQDRAAQALFAATELATPNQVSTEFGRDLPQQRFTDYDQRYRQAYTGHVSQLAATLSQRLKASPSRTALPKAFKALAATDRAATTDAWGTPLHLEPVTWYAGRSRYYEIRSAGPDRQFDTADDLTLTLEDRTGNIVSTSTRSTPAPTLDLKIEHDRGAFNGRTEITGSVTDQTGAIIPGATVTLRPAGDGQPIVTHTDARGDFDLPGLRPGAFTLELASPGFNALTRSLTLQARDRAVLAATLAVGVATETVEVQNAVILASPPKAPRSRGIMFAAGMGVMGKARAVPAPMAFAADTVEVDASALRELPVNGRSFAVLARKTTPATHIRSYFPEALYINPEILTDGKGNADITLPVADSITTWRMAMVASTQAGALGTGASSLKVLQDFFVDLDLPVTLTQGDRVTLPVALYNYTGAQGNVTLNLQPEDWYALADNDTPGKTIPLDPNHVGGSNFTLEARRIGKFKLTLTAHLAGAEGRDDIVVREIEVVPNGREQNLVVNGRLEATAQHELHFPANSIPDATSILVRLYPGPLSQLVEGMDSILSMPGGCFEQTSSSTYPNVLALDYMKHTNKLTPEVHAKAEGYIANGYQRLLTFEVPGGGFSWFGQAPANKILTAYGLMEFNDMSKVSDVDPRLIERTRDWLIAQQQPDGSWKPDTSFINEGATNRYNSDVARITAYIAWSLANTGYRGPATEKALQYLDTHPTPKPDPYTLAVIANFAADLNHGADFTRHAMQALLDARTSAGDQVYWSSAETGVYSTGSSAAIETTGLATQALLKWGQASDVARKALTYLASKKQASGAWGTTQATIMALRALLLASQSNAADVRGTLHVLLNGKTVETLTLTPENNDLLHQFVFKGIDPQVPNTVQLDFSGTGGLAYQIVGRHFTPWEAKPAREPLTIDLAYDRTTLAQNDIATATANVHNNLPQRANMVMVDLGIPPGFDLLTEDLQALQEKTANTPGGRLEKFSLTATQAILYFDSLGPDQTVTIRFRLRAKYPIHAHTFASRVYEYYDPDIHATAAPTQLEVTAH